MSTTIITTIIACSIFFSHNYSLLCSQRRHSNHECFFPFNFAHSWLNSYWMLPVLSCLSVCTSLQSNEEVQEVELSGFHVLGNSFATALLLVECLLLPGYLSISFFLILGCVYIVCIVCTLPLVAFGFRYIIRYILFIYIFLTHEFCFCSCCL